MEFLESGVSVVDGVGDGGGGVGAGYVAKKVDGCSELADGGLGLGLHARAVFYKNFVGAFGGSLEAKLLFVGVALWCNGEPEIAKDGFEGLGGGNPGREFIGSIWRVG